MRTTLPRRAVLIDELEVGLVDQCRRVERVPGLPAPALAMRHLTQFPIHERKERVERGVVSLLDRAEQARDILVSGVLHDSLSRLGGAQPRTIEASELR